MAARLSAMVGRTLIRAASEGRSGQRPRERLRYGDVLLLVRKRAQIAVYEQALAAAGIPSSPHRAVACWDRWKFATSSRC